MKHLVPNLVFISAELSDRSAAFNEVMTDILREHLTKTKQTKLWFQCQGSYLGRSEISFGVMTDDVGLMTAFAHAYQQESILVRYTDGSCSLVMTKTGENIYLGQWSEITEAQALRRDSYTKRGNQYYAAV